MTTTLSRRALGSVTILALSGRLDSNSSSAVEPLLMEGVQDEKIVLMDLSDVPYISSAGLRIVLKAAKTLRQSGGEFALCALKPEILKIFEISGLVRILRIFESPEEAASAFGVA